MKLHLKNIFRLATGFVISIALYFLFRSYPSLLIVYVLLIGWLLDKLLHGEIERFTNSRAKWEVEVDNHFSKLNNTLDETQNTIEGLRREIKRLEKELQDRPKRQDVASHIDYLLNR